MSSIILHANSAETDEQDAKNPFLVALGERVRSQRSRRGLTRKALAAAAGVSERHLANLEYGVGNASILVLQQVADALECPLAELHGDLTTANPEWLMLRKLLEHADEPQLKHLRLNVATFLGAPRADYMPAIGQKRSQRIALIGLRGAGKSTLGKMLADQLGYPFFEMSAEIEKLAGTSVAEIQALYGVTAYRRYERRTLDALIAQHTQCVIATPGGLVSDVSTFNALLTHCTSVWLQAEPQDHLQRVQAQGDMRPMAASKEALDDLKSILAGRAAFYSKADYTVNTSTQGMEDSFALLQQMLKSVVVE
jgi:XRE family transcriptional regulator, aerobic/anaerobic benzoate catabolism transcriptional regulator